MRKGRTASQIEEMVPVEPLIFSNGASASLCVCLRDGVGIRFHYGHRIQLSLDLSSEKMADEMSVSGYPNSFLSSSLLRKNHAGRLFKNIESKVH